MTILWWGMFSWTFRNNRAYWSRRSKNLRNHFSQTVNLRVRHVYLYSVGMFCWCCYKQEIQYTAKASGLNKHMCSDWLSREKGVSAKSRYVNGTEEEFLFGTRKLFFLGMCQFCFLSEASWKIVIFVFIFYFVFISFFHFFVFYISYLILTNDNLRK